MVTVVDALSTSFAKHRARFIEEWQHACVHLLPAKEKAAGDGSRLYRVSYSMVLAHEDKTYDGAQRGYYELAAGRDVQPFIRAIEGFATSTQLLPGQVWALPDQPKAHMVFGRPTGDAVPPKWRRAGTASRTSRDNTGAEAELGSRSWRSR